MAENRAQLGADAAGMVAETMRKCLSEQAEVNVIFAAAPSQNEFLAALVNEPGIDWGRVNAFHMDEYVGLSSDAPQRFGNFLKERIFDRVLFKSVHYLDGNAADREVECRRYSDLLEQHPVDVVCMGIGENCHIAFNDPHVADFNDPDLVKVVDLDDACRQQQVNDGCFATFDDVPTHALTLTIPALMRGKRIYCMVPGTNKAPAVYHTLRDAVAEQYPSTILQEQPQAILYIDRDSAARIGQ